MPCQLDSDDLECKALPVRVRPLNVLSEIVVATVKLRKHLGEVAPASGDQVRVPQ